ncbi:hypothetical protein ACFL26_00665 [Patescibacteria group bacterium]
MPFYVYLFLIAVGVVAVLYLVNRLIGQIRVTCALSGDELQDHRSVRTVTVLVPKVPDEDEEEPAEDAEAAVEAEDADAEDAEAEPVPEFETRWVRANTEAADILREQGMLGLRRLLRDRDLDKGTLIYVSETQQGTFQPVEARKFFAFLHEFGREGFDQVFEDYAHVAYDIPREAIQADVLDEQGTAEAAEEPPAEADAPAAADVEPEPVAETAVEPEPVTAEAAAAPTATEPVEQPEPDDDYVEITIEELEPTPAVAEAAEELETVVDGLDLGLDDQPWEGLGNGDRTLAQEAERRTAAATAAEDES